MIQLQNNFTTPKQSKQLLELGIPVDSADCFYKEPYTTVNVLRNCDEFSYYCGDIGRNVDYLKYTPCWSVGRLIEIWDICVNSMPGMDLDLNIRSSSCTYIELIISSFELAKDDGLIDFSKLKE